MAEEPPTSKTKDMKDVKTDGSYRGDKREQSDSKASWERPFRDLYDKDKLDKELSDKGASVFERGTYSWREEVKTIRTRDSLRAGGDGGIENMEWSGKEKWSVAGTEKKASLYADMDARSWDFLGIDTFARDRGYKPNASVGGTIGGEHAVFSMHADGRAEDILVKDENGKMLPPETIQAMKNEFRKYGLFVFDETDKKNATEHTTGYHLHVDSRQPDEHRERNNAADFNKHHKEGQKTRADLGLEAHWPGRVHK